MKFTLLENPNKCDSVTRICFQSSHLPKPLQVLPGVFQYLILQRAGLRCERREILTLFSKEEEEGHWRQGCFSWPAAASSGRMGEVMTGLPSVSAMLARFSRGMPCWLTPFAWGWNERGCSSDSRWRSWRWRWKWWESARGRPWRHGKAFHCSTWFPGNKNRHFSHTCNMCVVLVVLICFQKRWCWRKFYISIIY